MDVGLHFCSHWMLPLMTCMANGALPLWKELLQHQRPVLLHSFLVPLQLFSGRRGRHGSPLGQEILGGVLCGILTKLLLLCLRQVHDGALCKGCLEDRRGVAGPGPQQACHIATARGRLQGAAQVREAAKAASPISTTLSRLSRAARRKPARRLLAPAADVRVRAGRPSQHARRRRSASSRGGRRSFQLLWIRRPLAANATALGQLLRHDGRSVRQDPLEGCEMAAAECIRVDPCAGLKRKTMQKAECLTSSNKHNISCYTGALHVLHQPAARPERRPTSTRPRHTARSPCRRCNHTRHARRAFGPRRSERRSQCIDVADGE